jgi:hypothetical protein
MDWKEKLQSAKGALDQDSQRKLEENWPKIQQLFREKIGPAAAEAAKDDQKFATVAKIVYEALPFPVKLVVKQDAFLQFCVAHRDKLIVQADSAGA